MRVGRKNITVCSNYTEVNRGNGFLVSNKDNMVDVRFKYKSLNSKFTIHPQLLKNLKTVKKMCIQ